MDIGKSFTFLTEDERWLTKLGIGVALVLISSLLSVILIGFLGFFILAGYNVRLVQNVRDGNPRPLPEWDRWGDDLALGVKLVVAILIYTVPVLIIAIPMALGAILAGRGDGAVPSGLALMLCGGILAIVYAVALTVALPGIVVAFARDGSIATALEFNTIYTWTRDRLGLVLVVLLVGWGVSAIATPLAMLAGTLLCGIGLVVTIPLAVLVPLLVQSHLHGQLARNSAGTAVDFTVGNAAA